MFGMGGSEIIVILIIALLFLGPEKLPGAAKSISKGIRDIKKQSRALQQQIEGDEQIGGAIRDLKSALRGEEAPPPPRPKIHASIRPPAKDVDLDADLPAPTQHTAEELEYKPPTPELAAKAEPVITLPATAGEADDVADAGGDDDLAALVKPAPGTVAKGS